MDTLWLTFEATMSPDRPTRQAAEERLASPGSFGFGCAGEYALALLRFAVAPAVDAPPAGALGVAQNDADVRVAAAVRLKNSHTQSAWRDDVAFPVAARSAFRGELIEALFRADLNQRVRRLLLAVLQQVHTYDWRSGAWPELVPMVSSALESGLSEMQPMLDHIRAQGAANAAGTWAGGNAGANDGDAAEGAGTARKVAVAARLLTLCAKAFDDAITVSHDELDASAGELVPMVLTLLERVADDALVAGLRALRCEAGLLDPARPTNGGVLPNFSAVAAALDEAAYLGLKAIWFYTSTRIPLVFASEGPFNAAQAVTLRLWAAGNAGLADWRRGAVAATGAPLDDDDVQSSAERPLSKYFWKTYKRAAALSHRWIQNWILPKAVESRMKPAAAAFMATNTPALLDTALTTLWVHHNKSARQNPVVVAADSSAAVADNLPAPAEGSPEPPLHSKACIFAMEFVDVATGAKHLYMERIHPIAGPLLTDIVFERLQMTATEREQWSANPLEFVRRLSDPRMDHYSPKAVASALLVRLCIPAKKFQDKTLIAGFAQHIQQVLVNAPGAIASADGFDEGTPGWYAALSLDASLHAMTQLRSAIGAGWPLGDVMKGHVVPLLASPVGFLRARALHVLAAFLRNVDWSPDDYRVVLDRVVPLLDDPELPVRMRMAMSVAAFLRHPHAYAVVAASVGNVVAKLLEVMRLMDSESVVYALRQIIKHYSDTVAGWAVDLTRALVEHFAHLHRSIGAKAAEMADGDSAAAAAAVYRGLGGIAGTGEDDSAGADDDMEAACAAADELLATIGTLTKSIPATFASGDGAEPQSTAPIFLELQRILSPLIAVLLSGSSDMGFMDSTLRLLTRLVKRSSTVEHSTWECFRALHRLIVVDGATDYFAQLLPPIDNFLSVDPGTFVTASASATDASGSPAAMLAEMVERVLFDFGNARRRERIEAFKVIDIMMLSARHAANNGAAPRNAVAAFAQRYAGPLSALAGRYYGELQQRQLCDASASEWAIISVSYLACLLVSCEFNGSGTNDAFPTGHLQYVLSSFGGLATQTNLRVYDRKMFVLAVVNYTMAVAAGAASADGVDLQSAWRTIVVLLCQTAALEAAAVESCVYKAAKYEAKQKKGGHHRHDELDDAADSDLDDFTDDDDSDDDGSDGYSQDDDDDEDDGFDGGEDDGRIGGGDLAEAGLDDEGPDEDDKPIRNMDQFAHTVAAARRMAEREAGLVDDDGADDYDDAQLDHLEDCNFASFIDGTDEFVVVSDAFAALVAAVPAVAATVEAFGNFPNALPADARAPEMRLLRGRGFIPEKKQPANPPLVYSADPEAGDRFGGEPAPASVVVSLSDFLAAASRQRAFLREHKVRVKR